MAPASFLPLSNTVCVTDASGSLGTSLVLRLLRRGYTVHAAVQGHGEFRELKEGIASKYIGDKRLKIFKSDPFDYQSIVDALRCCSGLFYCFEPPPDHPTYDEHMTQVEVRAAHNVLEACAQVDTIDKVVFTSSITAVVWRDDRNSLPSDLDEKHWSEVNFCRKFKLWHALSKTVAEKSAWAMAMDRGISMVTVNAGLIVGPDLSITNPYLKGAAEMYEDGVLVAVDLEFLVDAHICVYEDISTYGRYLCFNMAIHRPENAMELAKLLAPSAPPQPQCFQEGGKTIRQKITNDKLNQLMVHFDGGAARENYCFAS
ncbi:hypothetical protein Nepgr_024437 [Nepenthes gracilis]|uniref:NAD-dependent epimerase/dehydratase domain-containing protein n=1 Tax=Nepenthes gracilis TaxID=150966 RepID=A0AAD3T570_NEPGR|nr:hypothetical protein Nepgr_024437 [Nepenthes gracilis]